MYYILKDKNPVACESIVEFAEWYKTPNRFLKKDKIEDYTISTIFLGIDHNHQDKGDPILFETLVTTDVFENKVEIDRYSTWEEAMNGHDRLLNKYTNLPHSAN
ncbi:MAG: hypothetical protein AAF849_06190 [Bacteroidota bacterium]